MLKNNRCRLIVIDPAVTMIMMMIITTFALSIIMFSGEMISDAKTYKDVNLTVCQKYGNAKQTSLLFMQYLPTSATAGVCSISSPSDPPDTTARGPCRFPGNCTVYPNGDSHCTVERLVAVSGTASVCAPNPCQHSGICSIDQVGGYKCNCRFPMGGLLCEESCYRPISGHILYANQFFKKNCSPETPKTKLYASCGLTLTEGPGFRVSEILIDYKIEVLIDLVLMKCTELVCTQCWRLGTLVVFTNTSSSVTELQSFSYCQNKGLEGFADKSWSIHGFIFGVLSELIPDREAKVAFRTGLRRTGPDSPFEFYDGTNTDTFSYWAPDFPQAEGDCVTLRNTRKYLFRWTNENCTGAAGLEGWTYYPLCQRVYDFLEDDISAVVGPKKDARYS